MNGYVYILQFKKSDIFYIGSTSDLERRLKQHLSGHTSTTKRLGEFNLVFSQQLNDLSQARKVERRIKSWKRRDYIEKIIQDGYIRSIN